MLNKVQLIGNLGRDPEVKTTAKGNEMCTFNLATTERWNDKNGDKQERTEWHRVVLFAKLATLANDYLHKGSKIHLEGKIRTSSYEKDGETRYSTEIYGDSFIFLDSKKSNDAPKAKVDSFDDDIPF